MADDECAAKHCDEAATLGMTWRFGDVRIEFYLCERHFDEIEAAESPTMDLLVDERTHRHDDVRKWHP